MFCFLGYKLTKINIHLYQRSESAAPLAPSDLVLKPDWGRSCTCDLTVSWSQHNWCAIAGLTISVEQAGVPESQKHFKPT